MDHRAAGEIKAGNLAAQVGIQQSAVAPHHVRHRTVHQQQPERAEQHLSVREAEQDKIAALDAGADDYLTKPFGTGELMARMRVVMRRQITSANEPIFTTGKLSLDFSHRLVTVNEKEIQLTPTEYDILRLLVTHAGKVLTHRQLLRQIWGEGYDDMHILRVNISNLRAKLEPDPARPTYIHTEAGVGYRLRTDDR